LGDYPIAVESPGNVEEIREKMIKALSDENLRKEMTIKGLECAKSFSWKNTAEQTLKILMSGGLTSYGGPAEVKPPKKPPKVL